MEPNLLPRSRSLQQRDVFIDTGVKMTHEIATNHWMANGKCVDLDPSLFFPSDGKGVEVAKSICSTCDMKIPCLEYALRNRVDHGVWGGASERQRRRILRARKELLVQGSSVSVR